MLTCRGTDRRRPWTLREICIFHRCRQWQASRRDRVAKACERTVRRSGRVRVRILRAREPLHPVHSGRCPRNTMALPLIGQHPTGRRRRLPARSGPPPNFGLDQANARLECGNPDEPALESQVEDNDGTSVLGDSGKHTRGWSECMCPPRARIPCTLTIASCLRSVLPARRLSRGMQKLSSRWPNSSSQAGQRRSIVEQEHEETSAWPEIR